MLVGLLHNPIKYEVRHVRRAGFTGYVRRGEESQCATRVRAGESLGFLASHRPALLRRVRAARHPENRRGKGSRRGGIDGGTDTIDVSEFRRLNPGAFTPYYFGSRFDPKESAMPAVLAELNFELNPNSFVANNIPIQPIS